WLERSCPPPQPSPADLPVGGAVPAPGRAAPVAFRRCDDVRARSRVLGAVALWAGAFAALRVSFLAPESCPSPGPAALEAAAVSAGGWLEKGEQDGVFVYEYNRADASESEGYNIVRHA